MQKDIIPQLNGKPYFEEILKHYDVKLCPTEDVEALVSFIDTYWRKDHPFVLSRELLDWQHLNKKTNEYNFIIAKHKESGELHSILGFLPTSQYDENIKNVKIWPCIWMVREDIKMKGLGTYLYYYLKTSFPVQTLSILGISEIALSIYKHWGFTTGRIQHHYILNPDKSEYELVLNPTPHSNKNKTEKSLVELSKDDFEKLPDPLFKNISKFKSKTYYVNRFYTHPIYTYSAKGLIDTDGTISNVFFIRNCSAKSTSALRIVDYIGPVTSLPGVAPLFINLLKETEAEYIDFVNVGMEGSELERIGFSNKNKSDIVLANYFEPYVQKNIELDYAHKTVADDDDLVFFKGDSDQDRPNLISTNS